MAEPAAPGLFEVLITQAVASALHSLPPDLVGIAPLRPAEAADRIALLVSRVVARVVESLEEGARSIDGVRIAAELVQRLGTEHPRSGVLGDAPVLDARVLRSITSRQPDGSPVPIGTPLIPLLDTNPADECAGRARRRPAAHGRDRQRRPG